MIQGFTQRGVTGMIVPPTLAEFEGLKASAVAVALTVFPAFPQMREKKVGSPARCTSTVTTGLMANAAGNEEQSVFELVVPPLVTEYVTVTEAVGIGVPPTAFCCTTEVATCVAGLFGGPQIACQVDAELLGSPLKPETDMTRAADSAAASAARCASSRAR